MVSSVVTSSPHADLHMDKAIVHKACSEGNWYDYYDDDEHHLRRDYCYTLSALIVAAVVFFAFRIEIAIIPDNLIALANLLVSTLIFTTATWGVPTFTVRLASDTAIQKVRTLEAIAAPGHAFKVEVAYVIYDFHPTQTSVGMSAGRSTAAEGGWYTVIVFLAIQRRLCIRLILLRGT